jgi:hypothetical protein
MDRPTAWASGLLALWALFLFLSCFLYGDWWPLFNIFFIVLGLLPYIFGSNKSNGLWGAIGDFVSGLIVVSIFAFPVVLHNAYIISPQALTLTSISNVFLLASLYIGLSYVSFS